MQLQTMFPASTGFLKVWISKGLQYTSKDRQIRDSPALLIGGKTHLNRPTFSKKASPTLALGSVSKCISCPCDCRMPDLEECGCLCLADCSGLNQQQVQNARQLSAQLHSVHFLERPCQEGTRAQLAYQPLARCILVLQAGLRLLLSSHRCRKAPPACTCFAAVGRRTAQPNTAMVETGDGYCWPKLLVEWPLTQSAQRPAPQMAAQRRRTRQLVPLDTHFP